MLMDKQNQFNEINRREAGFAALVIAIVLVSVLSLITVGFAELMRTEQRNALDKQLSSQAYYAAESGINDAIKAINAGYDVAKNDCGNGSLDTSTPTLTNAARYLSNNKVGNDETGASYSCLLINPSPSQLVYSPDTFTPTVSEFTARNSSGDAVTIGSITFSWTDEHGGVNPTNDDCSAHKFGPAGSGAGQWDYTGLLRVQLVPLNNLDRDSLMKNSLTAFMCPTTRSSVRSVSYAAGIGQSGGALIEGGCNTTSCSASINGLGGAGLTDQTTYLLIIRSIYKKVTVSVTAQDTSSAAVKLTGAQTVIDSTGKARDVLRRLQVRVPKQNQFYLPGGTGGGTLCKQVNAYPEPMTTTNTCQP